MVYLNDTSQPMPPDLNPTEVYDEFWIYNIEDHTSNKYPYADGKWMMIINKKELNKKWREACSLYKSGKLHGVNSMKVSTSRPNASAIYPQGYGIIIFYCGPSENKANVLAYGENILRHMFYNEEYFFYKSDKPHLINPNKKYKHLYYINTRIFYNELERAERFRYYDRNDLEFRYNEDEDVLIVKRRPVKYNTVAKMVYYDSDRDSEVSDYEDEEYEEEYENKRYYDELERVSFRHRLLRKGRDEDFGYYEEDFVGDDEEKVDDGSLSSKNSKKAKSKFGSLISNAKKMLFKRLKTM